MTQNTSETNQTIVKELEELYAINNSMFTDDPNSIPRFTDGTRIRPQDLADMNMNGLQIIAELIGIELGDQFNRNKQNGANYNESN